MSDVTAKSREWDRRTRSDLERKGKERKPSFIIINPLSFFLFLFFYFFIKYYIFRSFFYYK